MDSRGSEALTSEHVRVWLLLMLRASGVAGLAPITSTLFHRLVFLSNSLAHLYGANPPSEFVLKHKRGPFYPAAQFEVERMAAMGLVDIAEIDWIVEGGTVDARHNVSISIDGTTKAREWLHESGWCNQVDAFLTDLCAAVAGVDDGKEVNTVDQDLTYTQAWATQYSVIAFRRPEERLSERAARSIAELVPQGLTPSRQHQLRLYLKYLQRIAA